jgi:hypothetical protein
LPVDNSEILAEYRVESIEHDSTKSTITIKGIADNNIANSIKYVCLAKNILNGEPPAETTSPISIIVK